MLAIPDHKVQGVVCHMSNLERPLNPFTDPSGSSISCSRVGPVKFNEKVIRISFPSRVFQSQRHSILRMPSCPHAPQIDLSREGEDVFAQHKNMFLKYTKVRRLYDWENNTLVYVSYTDRILVSNKDVGDRFKSSITTVQLTEDERPPTKS